MHTFHFVNFAFFGCTCNLSRLLSNTKTNKEEAKKNCLPHGIRPFILDHFALYVCLPSDWYKFRKYHSYEREEEKILCDIKSIWSVYASISLIFAAPNHLWLSLLFGNYSTWPSPFQNQIEFITLWSVRPCALLLDERNFTNLLEKKGHMSPNASYDTDCSVKCSFAHVSLPSLLYDTNNDHKWR